MSYEIPSQLAYQEKIIFDLTFEQLVYAGIFLPLVVIILFKTAWPEFLRWMVSTIVMILGICFMFFDLKHWLKNWYEYLKLRKVDTNSERMIHFLEVKQIKAQVLTTKEKKLAFLKVEPLNFAIRTQEEQEMIIQQFKKFLNALDFPIQILMDTVPIRLEDYLTSLEKRVPATYKEQFLEYKKHLLTTIENDKILNRNFYVIIPQKEDLDIQVTLCQSRLNDLGLKTRRLTDNEIGSVISKFYRGDPITFCPDRIENNIDLVKVNEQLNRIVAAVGYPRLVEAGFLDKIVMAAGDFDLALHINPFPIEQLMVMLNKELQKQRADLYAAQLQNVINPSLEIQYTDTRTTLENLQKGSEKLFMVSLYINCRADTAYQLNLLTRKVQSELNSLMIQPKVPLFRMIDGLKSVAPLAVDKLKYQRNITSTALSAFFPFTSPFLQVDTTGVGFGLNKNNIPIIRDIFKLSNPNGCILATSGSGKSYMAKLFIARHLLNGTNVIIIDPQSEYKDLVRKFHGEVIALHRTSQTMINPLDLMGHDYAEKRLSLMDLMQVMLGELTEPQKSFIDRALTETYARKGITDDAATWNNKPPKLSDLLIVLEQMEKLATVMEKTTLRSLVNRLAMYVSGVFSFCNQDTNMQCNDTLVCFDIGAMPKQVKPVIMFLVLDYVYMKMRKDIHRKLLVVDEAWALLERSEEASYIFEIVKTCRKFNLGLLLINQEVEGLLTSKAGKSVLANSAYTILMRQKPSVMKDMEQTFDLSKAEVNYLLSASVGQGILIMENDHSELRILASPMEHELITTNADERLQKDQGIITENRNDVTITVDDEKGIYSHNKLTLPEIKYLIAKGYKDVQQYSITSRKKERFLLKPRFNEGINHYFLTMDIYTFIRQFTDKVWLYETIKPDIVFTIDDRQIGIEVETGKQLEKDKQKVLEKAAYNNEHYADWFFVVTDKNIVQKYKQFGKTIDKRSIGNYLAKICQKCPQPICSKKPYGQGI
ncbi:DUF87 domain-containing protein [Candidatus Woesearchaeota archaeon]|nr:DUF87 domain-containing protein [Candidatus Woesearchaeota archaeon]